MSWYDEKRCLCLKYFRTSEMSEDSCFKVKKVRQSYWNRTKSDTASTLNVQNTKHRGSLLTLVRSACNRIQLLCYNYYYKTVLQLLVTNLECTWPAKLILTIHKPTLALYSETLTKAYHISGRFTSFLVFCSSVFSSTTQPRCEGCWEMKVPLVQFCWHKQHKTFLMQEEFHRRCISSTDHMDSTYPW